MKFYIEIVPVMAKKFDMAGSYEVCSHYLGFIHGVSHLDIKNLYMHTNRQELIDQMFATLSNHEARVLA